MSPFTLCRVEWLLRPTLGLTHQVSEPEFTYITVIPLSTDADRMNVPSVRCIENNHIAENKMLGRQQRAQGGKYEVFSLTIVLKLNLFQECDSTVITKSRGTLCCISRTMEDGFLHQGSDHILGGIRILFQGFESLHNTLQEYTWRALGMKAGMVVSECVLMERDNGLQGELARILKGNFRQIGLTPSGMYRPSTSEPGLTRGKPIGRGKMKRWVSFSTAGINGRLSRL